VFCRTSKEIIKLSISGNIKYDYKVKTKNRNKRNIGEVPAK
jgi:hypothetical protein